MCSLSLRGGGRIHDMYSRQPPGGNGDSLAAFRHALNSEDSPHILRRKCVCVCVCHTNIRGNPRIQSERGRWWVTRTSLFEFPRGTRSASHMKCVIQHLTFALIFHLPLVLSSCFFHSMTNFLWNVNEPTRAQFHRLAWHHFSRWFTASSSVKGTLYLIVP